MNIKKALKVLIDTVEENYDQDELEDGDEPELVEALKVAKEFRKTK